MKENETADKSPQQSTVGTRPLGTNVEIVCGANTQTIDLMDAAENLCVGEIRRQLGDVLNIAPNAIAVIGDREVGDDRVLNAGDRLQFIKQSGSKG
jgi:hypothetical protein